MAYLQLNGCNLHYTDQGAGEPVLLIHGLGSSGRDWEHQRKSARDCGCVGRSWRTDRHCSC